jgi:hypothetical protein
MDFVDVGAVDVGIPDRLRIDHDAGSLFARSRQPAWLTRVLPSPARPSAFTRFFA